MPDINTGYKITFSENKKDMSLIAAFFIFVFFVLIISSTHTISYVISFITCIFSYIYCRYKIPEIWPESGTLLLFSKDKIELNLSSQSVININQGNSSIALVMTSSIQNDRFIILCLQIQNTHSNNKNWLILKRESMNTTDFTRLRRMILALKTNQQS